MTRDGCCLLMAKIDGVEQLKAPAETGDREMNSKRRAAAGEVEATLGKAAMIDKVGGKQERWHDATNKAEVEQKFVLNFFEPLLVRRSSACKMMAYRGQHIVGDNMKSKCGRLLYFHSFHPPGPIDPWILKLIDDKGIFICR